MKRNLYKYLSMLLSLALVLCGSFKLAMADNNNIGDTDNKTIFIDTLHGGATADGAELAFNGDEAHTQNGATVTVAKDSGNDGYSIIKKYTGDKLTFHGVSDGANNGNSGIKISFADGTNNTEDCKRYLEFTINTNAKGRSYAQVLAGETTLFSHWSSGDLVDYTDHVIRVEIDRTGDVPVAKLLLDGTEKVSENLASGSEEISLWLASYKTPTITISNVEYGKIDTASNDGNDEDGSGGAGDSGDEGNGDQAPENWGEIVFINTLHGGVTADGAELVFDGDEVHTQNGATVTVAKDSGNDGYSIIKKYTGDKLTFHGVSDGASNGNSGIKISFADGTNNTEGCKRYLEFTINTNAKGRTYAQVLAGETTLFSHWSSGDLVDYTDHVIRVEIDRTGDVPVAKLLLDGTEKVSENLASGSEEISIWLASYKTPTITISNVEYGKIGEVESGDSGEDDIPSVDSDDLVAHKANLIEKNTFIDDFNSEGSSGSSYSAISEGYLTQDGGGSVMVVDAPSSESSGNKAINYDCSTIASGSPRVLLWNPDREGIIEISFDIYCHDFNQRRTFNTKLNDTWVDGTISISMDGTVSASGSGTVSSKKINVNEWHTITTFYDMVAKKRWYQLDGETFYSDSLDEGYTFVNYSEFSSKGTNTTYDNFVFKSYLTRPAVSSAKASANSVELFMNVDIDSAFNDFSDFITLETSGEKVELTKVEYLTTNKKFVLTTKYPLASSVNYTVHLSSDIESTENVKIAENYSYTFITDAEKFDITSVTIKENGLIQAKVKNDSGDDKTIIMIASALSEDGAYISSVTTAETVVTSEGATLSLQGDASAGSYEIFFIDDWSSGNVTKKYIYGGNNTLPDSVATKSGSYINANFDITKNAIVIDAALSDALNELVMFAVASDVSSTPFTDSNKPLLSVAAYASDDGSINTSVKLSDSFVAGDYKVYVIGNGNYIGTDVRVVSLGESNSVLSKCNIETSASELATYLAFDNNIEKLGYDAGEVFAYIQTIASAIVANRPTGGYSLKTLVSTVDKSIAGAKINSGVSVDDVMKEYASSFGCTYADYANLDSEAKAEFDEVVKRNGLDSDEDYDFDKLSLIAKIRASSDNWSELKNIMVGNTASLGINLTSGKYTKLSVTKQAQVYKNIASDCAKALTVAEIKEIFLDEVDDMSSEQQDGSSSSPIRNTSPFTGASTVVQPSTSVVFTDISNHFAKEAIEFLTAKKIINGYEDATFRPNVSITRAEFAKIIAYAFDMKVTNGEEFDDVSQDDWFYGAVCTLSANGIVVGDGKSFNPHAEITRQDAAVIINRTLVCLGKSMQGEATFDDVDNISNYALDSVGALASLGVVVGNNNLFVPLNQITRGEAAVMIYRAFNLK